MFTYSPMTMKKLAGCSAKEYQGVKLPMIKAFTHEPLVSPFKDAVMDGSLILQKNFVEGVDDLVDAYWALQTMIRQENYPIR